MSNVEIICGEALEELARLPDASFDSLVTDPPAGISFMGKTWDRPDGTVPTFDAYRRAHNPADVARDTVGGRLSKVAPASYGESDRQKFVAGLTPIFAECLRVLKPGAHGLVWALPRTSHWTAGALEDAGFEIRDVVTHLFGSGFPKSLNVAKAMDGVVGKQSSGFNTAGGKEKFDDQDLSFRSDYGYKYEPATDDAKKWDGWGTALKPASEHWILVRKPCSEKTVAKNVLRWGTGALNIDASRVGYKNEDDKASATPQGKVTSKESESIGAKPDAGRNLERVEFERPELKGRWPANVVFSHSLFCLKVGQRVVAGDTRDPQSGKRGSGFYDVGSSAGDGKPCGPIYGDEVQPVYECVDDCPVRMLDEQSGTLKSGKPQGQRNATIGYGEGAHTTDVTGYGGQGGASRFFKLFEGTRFAYVAKPSKSEKNKGVPTELGGHPTTKPVTLMRYLLKMVTPPGGRVLDPFAGSGTTGVAAKAEGFDITCIEREPEYAAIARARTEAA